LDNGCLSVYDLKIFDSLLLKLFGQIKRNRHISLVSVENFRNSTNILLDLLLNSTGPINMFLYDMKVIVNNTTNISVCLKCCNIGRTNLNT
jgi:hypothetical protein